MRFDPSPDRNARIIKLWNEGNSQASIADMLGISPGMVSGVVWRERTKEQGQVTRPVRAKKVTYADGVSKRRLAKIKRYKEADNCAKKVSPVTLMQGRKWLRDEFTNSHPQYFDHPADPSEYFWSAVDSVASVKLCECRWPVNLPNNFNFCCAPVARGAYCEEHAAIAYYVPRPPYGYNRNRKWRRNV